MSNLSFTEDYPYKNASEFMQDEAKMQQLARGCIEVYLDSSDFEDFALQSIKDYGGGLDIGYPKEPDETIEEHFNNNEVLEMMKNYILSELGISNRY